MARALSTLGDEGIITDPILKLDKLLKYFYGSDQSQSSLSPIGSVKSLPKLVTQFAVGPDLKAAVDSALRALMSPYFDDLTLTVKIVNENIDNSEYSIDVAVKVYQDGKAYDGTDIRTVRNNFVQIFE